MKNNTLSPILLHSVVSPEARGAASVIPLDIYNPNKTAMLVDQIRFSGSDFEGGETTRTPFNVLMAVEILLGSIPITNKFVTLGALAPTYIGGEGNAPNPGGPLGSDADYVLTWHLPKPLYVPPMVQLGINLKCQQTEPGQAQTILNYSFETLAVRVSVVGRSLPDDYPIPGEIEVPWVTETQARTTDTRFVSRDNDLVNSNKVPLQVTQFVGISNAGRTAVTPDTARPTPYPLTVQMSLSNGTMLIRDQIPFYLAFPSDRRLFPLSARLQPGAFVRLELEQPVEPYGVQFVAVAMHGYRKIQTPGTLG